MAVTLATKRTRAETEPNETRAQAECGEIMSLSDSTFARLRSQMERAEIVLFTGAGFSMGAKDRQGRPVPSSTQLKEDLWALSYQAVKRH